MVCKGAQPSIAPPAHSTDNEKWPHLQDVPFPQVEQQILSPITGTNVPEAFVPLDICRGILMTPLQSVLALALLSSVEQGMEQHNRAMMFTIFTQQLMARPSTAK